MKQLHEASAVNSGNNDVQIHKSKRCGNVDCLVKTYVAWPQDTVLGGQSRQRVTHEQLSLTQWIQGFVRNIIEENCQNTRDHITHYLADIMRTCHRG